MKTQNPWARRAKGLVQGRYSTTDLKVWSRYILPKPLIEGARIKIKLGKGRKAIVRVFDQDINIKKQIFDSGFYQQFLRGMSASGEGAAFDVGAHVGLFSLFLNSRFPNWRVFAFEPERANHGLLVRNIAINGLHGKVVPIRLAISDRRKKAVMYTNKCDSGANSIAMEQPGSRQTVACTTIDEQARALGIKRLDLIKLDVEGETLNCLKGAAKTLRRFKPRLLVSAYHYPSEAAEVSLFLKRQGYSVAIKSNIEGKHIYARAIK